MDKLEFRAASSLAAVFSVRLLGLFMIYPVFAAYAERLSGRDPLPDRRGARHLRTGEVCEVSFGLLSDQFGRKRMIVIGLVLFAIGSRWRRSPRRSAASSSAACCRAPGAVGSVILALVADLTTEESRTKAMAMVGITIGDSFMIAVVTGPILPRVHRRQGIFWLMVALAVIGIAVTAFVVPNPPRLSMHRDAETVPALIGSVLWNGELLRLDIGVFALHAMLTASFLVVPGLLQGTLDIATHNDWIIYLPVLLISIAVMVPAIIVAEKYRRMKGVFVAAVVALLVSQMMLYFGAHNLYVLLTALTVFFSAFNVMEASLPSLSPRWRRPMPRARRWDLIRACNSSASSSAAWSVVGPQSDPAVAPECSH